jgi:hypothetical protein
LTRTEQSRLVVVGAVQRNQKGVARGILTPGLEPWSSFEEIQVAGVLCLAAVCSCALEGGLFCPPCEALCSQKATPGYLLIDKGN